MHLEITNWITIPVYDRQRAGNFYSGVLKLPAAESYMVDANVAYFPDVINGGYCGSMVESGADSAERATSLIYIYAFGEVDQVAESIIHCGGRILSMKTDVYPDDSVFIIFEDTEGNKLAFVGLRASQSQKRSA
jgi:predicted enzyme related to lactoylglutathione lyase